MYMTDMQLTCIKELGWAMTVVLSPSVVLFTAAPPTRPLDCPARSRINAQHNRQSPGP